MRILHDKKQIEVKFVYYGAELAGKTANLESLERLIAADKRSSLTKLDTDEERTLFFDRISITGEQVNNLDLVAKVYTVPGQQVHTHTRRNVLKGADGVVFVADSTASRIADNQRALLELQSFIQEQGMQLTEMPYVLQINKQDLPDKASDTDLMTLRLGTEPVQRAIAIEDRGTMETLRRMFALQAEFCRKYLSQGVY